MKTLKSPSRPRGGAAVAIIAVLVVAAVAFAIYWFVLRGGGGGAASALASASIPAEAEYVGGIDVPTILKSDLLKSLAESQGMKIDDLKAQLAAKGLKLEDVQTVAFGALRDAEGLPSQLVAVGKGTFDANALKVAMNAARGAEAAALGGLPVPIDQVEVVDPQTVVVGTADFVAKSVAVNKGTGKSIDDRAELKEVRGAIDQGAAFWAAGPVPPSAGRGFKGLSRMGVDLGAPTHFAVSADIDSQMKIRFAIRFDSGDAGAAASTLGGMLSMVRGMAQGPEAEVLKSLEVSGSGQVLTASITVDKAFLEQAASKKGGFGLPF